MRPLRHALLEVSRFGKVGVRVHQAHGQLERRRLGSLSLASTADRRVTAGVDARPPTRAMELRRAAEVQKCADKGWKSALICLGNMRKGGVSPGSAAYNVALKACAGAGEWGRAAALLEDMEGAGGATPDADMVVEIREALARAGEGEGGRGDGVRTLDDLSCDSAAPPPSSSSPDAGVTGSAGGAGSGLYGGGSLGSVAGMHTMAPAFGADGSWPSRRSAEEKRKSDGSGNTSAGLSNRTVSGSMSSGGSQGSVARVHAHAMAALRADSARPGRPSTYDDDSINNSGSSRDTASGASWGGWRWHKNQHTDQQHRHHQDDDDEAVHAGAFNGGRAFNGGKDYGGSREAAGKKGAWPPSPAAPFAGCWGDD